MHIQPESMTEARIFVLMRMYLDTGAKGRRNAALRRSRQTSRTVVKDHPQVERCGRDGRRCSSSWYGQSSPCAG